MIFPTSLTQKELRFDAHGKISKCDSNLYILGLLEKLLGNVKECDSMKKHYVKMLVTATGAPLDQEKI